MGHDGSHIRSMLSCKLAHFGDVDRKKYSENLGCKRKEESLKRYNRELSRTFKVKSHEAAGSI